MKAFFKNVVRWIVLSSANPREASLTVSGLILAVIPYVLSVSSLACGMHICTGLTQNDLTDMAGIVSNIVFWFLSIVSGAMVLYGFLRKVLLTLTGNNQAIQS